MATDFVRPVDAVRAAMPGTLGELAQRTGFPEDTVLRNIGRLRAEGVRVNAIEQGHRSVGRWVEAEWLADTVYQVDEARAEA